MMTSRSRGYNDISSDWDPMRSEFERSTYDSQTREDNAGGGVMLDHSRLYITNIPKGLNEDGLRSAFNKYGTLCEVFLSNTEEKRYGLVRYETTGEAKLAMMKLNRTEPLKLNVSIAKKSKTKFNNGSRGSYNNIRDRTSYGQKANASRENDYDRETSDSASVSSRGRKERIELANDDKEVYVKGGDMEMEELDPDLELELERLRLQEVQIMYKQRLRAVKLAEKRTMSGGLGSRCLMPDGRIVVRASEDRPYDSTEILRDGDSSFGAGAGDSNESSRACVGCGAPADTFCARCGVTPYCGQQCQKRDWTKRHSSVCHNLARTKTTYEPEAEPPAADLDIKPAAPLRRPRSPVAAKNDSNQTRRTENGAPPGSRFENNSSVSKDNQGQKYPPSGQISKDSRPNYNRKRDDNRGDNRNRDDNRGRPNDRAQNRYQNQRFNQNRNQQTTVKDEEEEDWGNTNTETSKSTSSTPTTIPKPVTSEPSPAKAEPKPVTEEPKKPAMTPAPFTAVTNKQVVNSVEEKPLVPAKCVIELLDTGATVLISIDNLGKDCNMEEGYMCLSLHEDFQDRYMILCEGYIVDCEDDKEDFKPEIGDIFSYLDPADGCWYRARKLSDKMAALFDASRIVQLTPETKCRAVSSQHSQIPEFACHAISTNSFKVGDNFKCTIKSKTADGVCSVVFKDVTTESVICEGQLKRWKMKIEYPPVVKPIVNQVPPTIPEVSRPPLKNKSEVLLLVDPSGEQIFVRPADANERRRFDMIEQDVAMYSQKATPLSEPPTKGQTLIAKLTDGNFYRVLCKRTSVKQNKYLLEYIDYGTVEISTLEKLYPCPKELDLSDRPSLTSAVVLKDVKTLSEPALQYLKNISTQQQVVILTLPNGVATAPSGSEATLTLEKNRENIGNKLVEMCKPEWKKFEEKGGDVFESEVLMLKDVEYLELPKEGGTMQILDCSLLAAGQLSICSESVTNHIAHVLGKLTEEMSEYCNSNLGRDPYLPRLEELCIAKFPPYEQWFRAVLCELDGNSASLLYLDYGNLEVVDVSGLRKMMAQFVRGVPVLACSADIKDFPKEPTEAQIKKAREYLNINEDGTGGVLLATKCELVEPGSYIVHAPALIEAVNSA